MWLSVLPNLAVSCQPSAVSKLAIGFRQPSANSRQRLAVSRQQREVSLIKNFLLLMVSDSHLADSQLLIADSHLADSQQPIADSHYKKYEKEMAFYTRSDTDPT